MAVDHDCSPEIAALIGTSAALAISDIPWNGPVAALKVGLVDGKLVFNPDSEQRKVSDLDVTVVSTGKKVVMIEAGANEVPNDVMFEAIKQAHEENQKQIALINQMVQEIGKPKFDYPHADFNYELFNKITADFMDEAKAAMDTDDKNVREERLTAAMHAGLPLYRATRAVHSCFVLHKGEIVFACEDLGRHNALDKAVGCAVLAGLPLAECVLYTSGRVPLDMVRKAIRAGVPVLVSKSMPTVQSAELAAEYGLQLVCGRKFPKV